MSESAVAIGVSISPTRSSGGLAIARAAALWWCVPLHGAENVGLGALKSRIHDVPGGSRPQVAQALGPPRGCQGAATPLRSLATCEVAVQITFTATSGRQDGVCRRSWSPSQVSTAFVTHSVCQSAIERERAPQLLRTSAGSGARRFNAMRGALKARCQVKWAVALRRAWARAIVVQMCETTSYLACAAAERRVRSAYNRAGCTVPAPC